jgi:hypothetical protein
MKSILHRFIHLFLVLVGIACSGLAQADYAAYEFKTVDYPHAVSTQLWGINDAGQIIGTAQFIGKPTLSFLYNPKNGVFTSLPPVPGQVESDTVSNGFIGINDPGVVVGETSFDGSTQSGVILHTNGTFTFFQHPGRPITIPRAVGDSGLVTGYASNLDGSDFIGFIYDPASTTFIDFLDSPQTIAQGINTSNQVVGSAFFFPNGVYAGSPPGQYGFLRESGGAITLFRVNSSRTRARGINDFGSIAGFVTVPPGIASGFVGTLAGLPGPGLNIPDADLLKVPGAVNTFAQAINNAEQVVGAWDDGNPNGLQHGFIATPPTIGPVSMEGDLRLNPSAQPDGKLWVAGGYSFTIPGSHLATTLTFSDATISLPVRCTSNGPRVPAGDIVVPLADSAFPVPANNTSWFPIDPATGTSAGQASPASFEGAVEVTTADVIARCGAGATTLFLNYGGDFGAVFSANVSSSASPIKFNVKFHYRSPAGKGKIDTNCSNPADPNAGRSDVCGAGWSSTQSFSS